MKGTYLKKNRVFLCLLILAHAIGFCAAVFLFKRPYSYDSTEYIQLAGNLKHGWYYAGNPALPVDAKLLSLRPPVYSLFLLLIWSLFGQQTWTVLLFQNLLSIFNCLLVYDTFEKLSISPTRKNYIYWILVLAFPMQIVYTNMIFSDVLFQCFLMLYLRQLLFFINDHQPRRILSMSIWLIAGVFTKPILFPYLLLHAIFSIIVSIKSRRWILSTAGLLPLLLLFAYGQWNKKQTGLFHISSVQSINMLEYNLSEFYISKYGHKAGIQKIDSLKEVVNAEPDFRHQYEKAAALASAKMKEDILGYGLFHFKRSLQLFIDPDKLEFDIFSRQFYYKNNSQTSFKDALHNEGIKGAWAYIKSYPYLPFLIITPLFGLIRILGLLLYFFERKHKLQYKIAIGIFVLYFACITGPVANARYFMPLILPMSFCAGLGYAGLIEKIKLRRNHVVH